MYKEKIIYFYLEKCDIFALISMDIKINNKSELNELAIQKN